MRVEIEPHVVHDASDPRECRRVPVAARVAPRRRSRPHPSACVFLHSLENVVVYQSLLVSPPQT